MVFGIQGTIDGDTFYTKVRMPVYTIIGIISYCYSFSNNVSGTYRVMSEAAIALCLKVHWFLHPRVTFTPVVSPKLDQPKTEISVIVCVVPWPYHGCL